MQQAVAAVHLTQVALAGGKLGRADLERISSGSQADLTAANPRHQFGSVRKSFFHESWTGFGLQHFFLFQGYPTRQYLGRADLTGGKPSRSEIGPWQTQIRSVPVRFSQMHQIKSDEYF